MKLTVETFPNKDEAIITLDGKSVTAIHNGSGGKMDCRELPDYTIGRAVIEQQFQLALNLLEVEQFHSTNDIWNKVDEDTLEAVYDCF